MKYSAQLKSDRDCWKVLLQVTRTFSIYKINTFYKNTADRFSFLTILLVPTNYNIEYRYKCTRNVTTNILSYWLAMLNCPQQVVVFLSYWPAMFKLHITRCCVLIYWPALFKLSTTGCRVLILLTGVIEPVFPHSQFSPRKNHYGEKLL